MNLRNTIAAAIMGLALITAAVPAQADGEGGHIPGHPRVNEVNHRFENQHDRIQQGLKNGSLSHAELATLRGQRAAMKTEEHTMRADDGGHLTKADQRALNQQENQRSREIYQFKHN